MQTWLLHTQLLPIQLVHCHFPRLIAKQAATGPIERCGVWCVLLVLRWNRVAGVGLLLLLLLQGRGVGLVGQGALLFMTGSDPKRVIFTNPAQPRRV
jgi:hypothetical protein